MALKTGACIIQASNGAARLGSQKCPAAPRWMMSSLADQLLQIELRFRS